MSVSPTISSICIALPEFVVNTAESLLFAFLFAGVVLSWFFVRQFPTWFLSLQSSNWPTVIGAIETGDVTAVRSAGVLRKEAEYVNAEIGFSYVVDGERYSGYYAQQFFDEQAAWEFVDTRKGRSAIIRYKKGKPQSAVFRPKDQQSAQLMKPGVTSKTS